MVSRQAQRQRGDAVRECCLRHGGTCFSVLKCKSLMHCPAGDIKPANWCFVDNQLQPAESLRLVDFGCSQFLGEFRQLRL